MLHYSLKLEFEEEPDYEYLENLLLAIKERYRFKNTFQWEKKFLAIPDSSKKKKKKRMVKKVSC
jgi:hypothetical protein